MANKPTSKDKAEREVLQPIDQALDGRAGRGHCSTASIPVNQMESPDSTDYDADVKIRDYPEDRARI